MDRRSKDVVLVTGDASYTEFRTTKALNGRRVLPVIYGNLSSDFREPVRWSPLVRGDIRDVAALSQAMSTYGVHSVIHFAGPIEVGRSFIQPGRFWDINVAGTGNVLAAMRARSVERLVFSLSAAALSYRAGPRRAGDPASLGLDPTRAQVMLGWKAAVFSPDQIVARAERWDRRHAYGAGRRPPSNVFAPRSAPAAAHAAAANLRPLSQGIRL